MHTLTITDENEEDIARIRIQEVDPTLATVAILQALAKLPAPKPPRRTRCDAGKPRDKATPGNGTGAQS